MANENNLCTGTISIIAGDDQVNGGMVPTNFIPQLSSLLALGACYIKVMDDLGVYRCFQVKSVESDTVATLFETTPVGSDVTEKVFYAGTVLETYIQPGAAGTGTISSTGGQNAIVGTGTNFDPQTPNGTLLTWLGNNGSGQSGTVNVVTNDTHLTLQGLAAATSTTKAFVYKTGSHDIFGPVTGTDGAIYTLQGTNIHQGCPGPAVAAFIALGWRLVASPAAPSPDPVQHDWIMFPPTNDDTPYDVIGADEFTYHLRPYDEDGTFLLFVPGPAVNAALADGWTM